MKTIFTQFLKGSWLSIWLMCISLSLWAKPMWTFSVVVAVDKQTADFYQTMLTRPIDQIVREQMATINANFNNSGNFNGIYNFRVDSIYVFDSPAQVEVYRGHPRYDYSVVIDGKFIQPAIGGGWYGSYQTIYHSWSWSYDFGSGPFGPGATDGLTHEFGHARGAVDIYGMRVEGAKNPVNGETFEPVNSIMNYPYGNIVWDEYTSNLLNSTAAAPILGEQWITEPFPRTMTLKAVDAQGNPLEGALLELYPEEWFSYTVSSTPVLRLTTMPNGTYVFDTNPFQPSTSGYPWTMRYSNFLVKATYNSVVVYKWMPLYEVQNAYFRNGANSVYTAVVQFPTETPVIQISRLNASDFKANDPISVSFTAVGTFKQGNTFSLQLIDDQNNTFTLQTIAGTEGAMLTGLVPKFTTTQRAKVRIVSSDPRAQSSDYGIIIRPTQLTLLAPSFTCQTGEIHFNSTGGDGSLITYTAPGITRAALTDNFGIVEPELRNDPKIIPITASQSGYSVTYLFDLKAACSNVVNPKPPVLNQSIPDQVLTVGQPVPGSGFNVGLYFSDPTPFFPTYSSDWLFRVDGLPQGLYVFAKDIPSSPNPIRVILGTPTVAGIYSVTITASTAAYRNNPLTATFQINVISSQSGGPLVIEQPSYNCQTGAIVFNTSGGDGSPITYIAPGITRAAFTDNFGVVEQGLRNDPKPITIEATQGQKTVQYVFDFDAYCNNPQPPTKTLVLLPPTYNCSTGALHFNTAGGDGSSIEFMATGITPWTTTPDQFVDKESRTANDVHPFTLMARQSGQVVTYTWDLKMACGRARMGIQENVPLTLTALGNPVQEQLRVLIQGAEAQSVQLLLSDVQGRVIESRWIEQASNEEIQSFSVNLIPAGVLIVQATTNTQKRSIRIIRR